MPPHDKEQLNIRLPKSLATQLRRCAAVRNTSLNQWVAAALADKAREEYRRLHIDELEQKFAQTAGRYAPGRAATLEQMLAFAKTVAEEDSADGLDTRYVPPARTRSKVATAPRTAKVGFRASRKP